MREFIGLENDNGIQNIKTSQLPIINIKINNTHLKALIDTGSEISLINKNLFDKRLQNLESNCIKISKIKLMTASGKKFAECSKVLSTEFIVENHKFKGEFILVSDMHFDVILGEDILSQLMANIDLGERFLLLEGTKVPMYNLNELMINNFDGELAEVNNVLNGKRANENEGEKYIVNNFAQPNEYEMNCPTKYNKLIHELLQNYVSLIKYEPRFATGYIHKLQVDESKPFKCKTYPFPYEPG